MSRILMLKNNPVFNIDSEQTYNSKLLPGYMQKLPCVHTYKEWIKERYSSGSNTLARLLQGKTFGQGRRDAINAATYALSLSDCYWIKESDDTVTFEDVSPYYNDFWKGINEYKSGSIPTLYVAGAMSKEWINKDYLKKECDKDQLFKEKLSIDFCKECGVLVNDYYIEDNILFLKNFTSPEIMLEQANMSGLIDKDYFTSANIVEVFKEDGVKMLAIDAILGNGDRHAGNFGFLRDTNTGEYLSMAPLYDFDHTFDSSSTNNIDVLIRDLNNIPKEYHSVIKSICVVGLNYSNDIIQKRSLLVCNELGIEINQNCAHDILNNMSIEETDRI